MQPIRSTHHITRTTEGDDAWRTQALDPSLRTLLGHLRVSQSVADILKHGTWAPADLERALNKMASSGWIVISEPEISHAVPEEDVDIEIDESTGSDDLALLLSRHRQDEISEWSENFSEDESTAVEDHQAAASPNDATALALDIPENTDELPFNYELADDDGLFNALRNPELSAEHHQPGPEWAPPSGGLAALLRALGETLPEGVDLSPDQKEHLADRDALEPWGGGATVYEADDPKPALLTPFARLRDQPQNEDRKGRLGALHESLGKVQKEQAEANAARERARQAREKREMELKNVHQEQQLRRQQEEKAREGATLLGLSAKLAKVKNNRNNND